MQATEATAGPWVDERRFMSARMVVKVVLVAVFLSLITSALTWTQVATNLVPSANAEAANEHVAVRDDAVSAMLAARTQGTQVEDLSARTSTSATFANPDGTWTLESYAGVVRSQSEDDKWVPIDTTVEDRGSSFEANASPIEVAFSDGGDRAVGTAQLGPDSSVGVGWPTKLPTPRVEGSELTYADAVEGGDLVVDSFADGFRYSIVLEEAPDGAAQLEYRIPLRFEGVAAKVRDDGSIVITDGKARVGIMTPPVMWEHAPEAESGRTIAVDASVEGGDNTRTLVLRPDMSFLLDPSTVYPVTVDPQFSFSAAGDTYAESTSASGQPSAAELRVGSTTLGITQARSYLSFDLSALSGVTGTASQADLHLSNFLTGSCNGSAVRASRVTETFNIGTIKWSNKPATTTTGSTTTTASSGASSCPAETVVSWDATQIVNDARAAGTTLLGVEIKADSSTNTSGYRKYRSLENGDPNKAPKLVVTFNKTPDQPTGLSVSPGNPGYSTSTTPTLSAVVSDPDAGATRGSFQVKSGSTVIWSGASQWATSGARVQVNVPSGLLTHGATYTAVAFSEDELVKSASSTSTNFTVDTSAPTTTITSTGYTNGVWTSSVPHSNTFTYTGPSDTATFETTTNGIPRTVQPFVGTSSITFPLAPIAFWNTLQVNAVDKAGNRGPTSTFSFGSGAPGFSAPYPNSRSTTAFPLDVSAPPGATGVDLLWKLNGESTWRPVTQVTKAGSPWSGVLSTAGGRSYTGQLTWKATDETFGTGTLTAPAAIKLTACFRYPSGDPKCTYTVALQLVPSAMGGTFPTADLGPVKVALLTGEATINDLDTGDSDDAGLARTFSSYDSATIDTGLFGPGWSDPAPVLAVPGSESHAEVFDSRQKDGTLVIVDADGSTQTFIPDGTSTTQWVPMQPTGDSTSLTLTPAGGGSSPKLVLSRPFGTGAVKTEWTYEPSDVGPFSEWVFRSVDAPGTSSDVIASNDHQRLTFLPQSDPGASATCNAATQSVGCRGLKVTYMGTGSTMRVASVSRVRGAVSQSGVTETTIADYSYDSSGLLKTVCTAAPDSETPPLCTTYSYVTVNGRTLIAQAKPAGLKAWRFDYDATGRLTAVKREKPTGGDAVWSVDYSLTPSSSGLPDLSAATAAQWGQQAIPTKVVAVYSPFNGSSSISKANLYYFTDDGLTTNTAGYGTTGWLVGTSWYNADGNVVQNLDTQGWARVQAAPVADRPRVASEASSYTVYNSWGDERDGTRVVDQYGPAHTAARKNGTIGLFRSHTKTMYDDSPDVDPALIANKPSSAANLGLVVKTTVSVSDVARTTDYDGLVTTTSYDPAAFGDGDGWALGSPTKVVTNSGGSPTATTITRYNSEGRVIETRRPGGSSDSNGVGNDARSTVTTYYSASGSGDCGNRPEWQGLVCKVGAAAQPSGATVQTTYYAAFNSELQPTVIQEISGGVLTRTTTATYDALDRKTSLTKQTTGSGVDNESITTDFEYDNATGLPTTMRVSGEEITTEYDSWGRASSYTDAFGSQSTKTYDAAGNVATYLASNATYTYSYDSHNRMAAVDAGGSVGSFSMAYNADGSLASVTYPNGMVGARTYDEIGDTTGLTYSQGSTVLLSFTTGAKGGGQFTQTSPASSQAFGYDDLGRLVKTEDHRGGRCTTRTYGFDSASNRTSSATFDPGAGGACQNGTAATSKSNSYDSADRITNTGYTYDTLGRTQTMPQSDAGPTAVGPLTATYHADDKVATLSQSITAASGLVEAVVMNYTLDPSGRINAVKTLTNGVETARLRYRFAGTSDAPSSIDSSGDGGMSWASTRYVSIPALGFAATVVGGATSIKLSNIHGDIVGSMSNAPGTAVLASYTETDEFGGALADAPSAERYGYLGTHQRSTDTPGRATTLMGARVYNPATGAFLSRDSVAGANQTPYTYPQDPIGSSDINGAYPRCSKARYADSRKLSPIVQPVLFPFRNRGKFVGVPGAYCYNPDQAGDDWHDYCSFGQKDMYHNVSFKGPCAYHDMCLQYGWGAKRSDCDHLFRDTAFTNCLDWFVVRDHWNEGGTLSGCFGKMDRMYKGLQAKTWWDGEKKYSRARGLNCVVVWTNGYYYPSLQCLSAYGPAR